MATHVKTPDQLQESGTGLVHSLAKGLEILSCFSEGELLGNQQLVELTGLPKATVSRLTSTLVKLGYLQVDPRSRKLAMGARVLGLGVSVDQVSWGTMLSEAQSELILGHWWQLAAATLFMAVFVTAFSLMTDALRDALDPKLRGAE